jgi:hypothetical protein
LNRILNRLVWILCNNDIGKVLEKEFRWKTGAVGYAIGITFLVGVPVGLFGGYLRGIGYLTIWNIVVFCAGLNFFAAVCFFPVVSGWLATKMSELRLFSGESHQWLETKVLLTVDSLVLGFSYLGGPLLAGVAMREAIPGSAWSPENYYMFSQAVTGMSGPEVGLERFRKTLTRILRE